MNEWEDSFHWYYITTVKLNLFLNQMSLILNNLSGDCLHHFLEASSNSGMLADVFGFMASALYCRLCMFGLFMWYLYILLVVVVVHFDLLNVRLRQLSVITHVHDYLAFQQRKSFFFTSKRSTSIEAMGSRTSTTMQCSIWWIATRGQFKVNVGTSLSNFLCVHTYLGYVHFKIAFFWMWSFCPV